MPKPSIASPLSGVFSTDDAAEGGYEAKGFLVLIALVDDALRALLHFSDLPAMGETKNQRSNKLTRSVATLPGHTCD